MECIYGVLHAGLGYNICRIGFDLCIAGSHLCRIQEAEILGFGNLWTDHDGGHEMSWMVNPAWSEVTDGWRKRQK